MNFGNVAVYYSNNFGYLVASETTIKDSIVHATVNPVRTEKANISAERLGECILNGLKTSQTAIPVELSEAQRFKFWQVTGIKGFSSFSKKFKCIDISSSDNSVSISKLFLAADGGYSYPENSLKVNSTISMTELGELLIKMFTETEKAVIDEKKIVSTVNGNTVRYISPSDHFVDMRDGHTDAYQVYTLENNDKSYIAFLIDNGYSEFTESAIKERWQQIYGELLEFCFNITANTSYKIQVIGKTDCVIITSYIFQAGDDMLKVLCEINLLDTSNNEIKIIKDDFNKIISSIEILRGTIQ